MDISFFDREIFTSPTSGVDGGSVERGAASQIVEENREKRGEDLWGVRWFPVFPFPFIILEAEVLKLDEVICATPIFKRLKSRKGAQGIVIKDAIRPDVYCVSIYRDPREFGLNNWSCTFEETPDRRA